MIRPDLRGHGKSVGKLNNYFSRSVEDLKETMDELKIDKFHVAGVSLGGIVALLFAQKYPNKTLSLCFSGVTPNKPSNSDELREEERKYFEEIFNNPEISNVLDQIHGKNYW